MRQRHVFFRRYLPAPTVQCARGEGECAGSGRAGAGEVERGEGREVGEDGWGRAGGEEEADGAVEVGGKQGGLRVGFGFGGEAESDGHYFCFAEEESERIFCKSVGFCPDLFFPSCFSCCRKRKV